MMAKTANDSRPRVLFVLLLASYAYFYQAGGWNQNSRFALVRAMTNEHTLNIDPFQHATGDRASFEGHFYSDKAPGLALAAVPIVAFVRPIWHAFGGDPETLGGLALLSYIATLFTAGLLTAIGGVALYRVSLDLGASEDGAAFATLTFGLATPIWTLATIFIGHAFAAGLLVVAFWAAMRIGRDDPSRDVRLAALVGAGAGWATISEFPAAIPAVVIALVTVGYAWPLGRTRAVRILGTMTATALACAAVLMVYQYACFGSPFHLAYTSEPEYAGMQEGILGVSLPKMIRLRRILFGDYRGLLPLAPTLALAPFGLLLMLLGWGQTRVRTGVRPGSDPGPTGSDPCHNWPCARRGHRRIDHCVLFRPAERELFLLGRRLVLRPAPRLAGHSVSLHRAGAALDCAAGDRTLGARRHLRLRCRRDAGRRLDHAAAAGEHPPPGRRLHAAGVLRRRPLAQHAEHHVRRRGPRLPCAPRAEGRLQPRHEAGAGRTREPRPARRDLDRMRGLVHCRAKTSIVGLMFRRNDRDSAPRRGPIRS